MAGKGTSRWVKGFWMCLLLGAGHFGLSGQAALPDSLYLALVDSTLADLGKMDAVHPVLGYLQHAEKQVYHPPEGIQIRVKAQHNARKLPADDYYTLLELMFELRIADGDGVHDGHGHAEEDGHGHGEQADHDHGSPDGPLLRYSEREMGVDMGWQLGRLKVDVQIAGKGNEHLAQRMMEEMEKRFEGFREAHGLPRLYNAEERLPEKDVNTTWYLLRGLQGLQLEGKGADRMDFSMAVHGEYWERRLGMVWKNAEGSERFTMEMTMRDEQPEGEDKGSLTEASAFRFRVLRRKHVYLRMNLATNPGSALGQEIDKVVDYYQPDFE